MARLPPFGEGDRVPLEEFWSSLGTTLEIELGRYDAVIHLRTPAKEHGYNHQNPLRTESASAAADIDARIVRPGNDILGDSLSSRPPSSSIRPDGRSRSFGVSCPSAVNDMSSRRFATIKQHLHRRASDNGRRAKTESSTDQFRNGDSSMGDTKKIRVAVNGYGVIGKRVAAAVARQEDMSLAGVSDVVTDWRAHMVTRNGFPLFGATGRTRRMRCARPAWNVAGTLDELLGQADVVVDCTPKRIAAKNIDMYRRRGLKFILQGGEKHSATGHSFVAESNYASALDREATRVVSCNTTSIVRTLTALKRAGLLQRARGHAAAARH